MSMMVMINMTEVASYTYREFLAETMDDMGALYQIALEVNRRNKEAMEGSDGKVDDDDAVTDSKEVLDFIDSLREE